MTASVPRGCAWDAESQAYRPWDDVNGRWREERRHSQPRETAEELARKYDGRGEHELPGLALEAVTPLTGLLEVAMDPEKTALRADHATRLAQREALLPALRREVEGAEEALAIAQAHLLNGLRTDTAAEHGALLEAQANLRKVEQEVRAFERAIADLDKQLASHHREQRADRRSEIERRLAMLARRQHRVLTEAARIQMVAAELARLRHHVLEPHEQRQPGTIGGEWTYANPARLLDQLEAAMRQDCIGWEM